MNNEYNNDELYHYGRVGMKWGQRIFGTQPSSGSHNNRKKKSNNKAKLKVTELLQKYKQKRLSKKLEKQEKAKLEADRRAIANTRRDLGRTEIKKISSSELQRRITRLKQEKELRDAQRDMQSASKKVGRTIITDVFGQAAKSAATSIITDGLKKYGSAQVNKFLNKDKTFQKFGNSIKKEQEKRQHEKDKAAAGAARTNTVNNTYTQYNQYNNKQKTGSYDDYDEIIKRARLTYNKR